METKALISTIQGYATKDGPGLRSTVFFVGCNLRCLWCSNPELMYPNIKTMFFKERCHGTFQTKEECELIYPDAFETVGYEITVDTLLEKLLRDKVFFDASGGGVTLSGGEPALFYPFVIELARKLRAAGVHVALDTAGHYSREHALGLAKEFDLFLYDIKAFDNRIHEKCTGVGNHHVIENLRLIADAGTDVIIRLVIIPGHNDDYSDVIKRIDFIAELGSSITRLDILRYHNLGDGKYTRLGLVNPISDDAVCDEMLIKDIYDYACSKNLNVYVE